jgi:hypothetical protein
VISKLFIEVLPVGLCYAWVHGKAGSSWLRDSRARATPLTLIVRTFYLYGVARLNVLDTNDNQWIRGHPHADIGHGNLFAIDFKHNFLNEVSGDLSLCVLANTPPSLNRAVDALPDFGGTCLGPRLDPGCFCHLLIFRTVQGSLLSKCSRFSTPKATHGDPDELSFDIKVAV